MCYLLRHHAGQAQPDAAIPPPHPNGLRLHPRWIGGVTAATFIGGLAVAAAMVVAPSAPPQLRAGIPAATAPGQSNALASSGVTVPAAGGGIERTSLPMDDDVPTAPAVARGGMGHCDHAF